jgi:hypothetical protein
MSQSFGCFGLRFGTRFIARFVVLSCFLMMVGTTLLAQSNLSALDGVWLGTLFAGPQTLRLQLHLQGSVAGAQNCARQH